MSSIKLKGSTSGDVTITVPAQAGTNTVTIPAVTGTLPLSNLDHVTNRPNAKPLIINGDMAVAQRATSVTGVTSSGYRSVDRFRIGVGTAGTWTFSQSTTVPTGQGFSKSHKFDCTTANASLSADSILTHQARLEGQDLQLFKKGTSNAEYMTIAFWVRSNKTGTYVCELFDNDNNRHIAQTYTISSADTWEKKVLSFAGDTTGAFGNDEGNSLDIRLHLAGGSNRTGTALPTSWASTSSTTNAMAGQTVNLADSTDNEWYITGLQLEVGEFTSSTLPPFQHETNFDNHLRCARYFQAYKATNGQSVGDGFSSDGASRGGIRVGFFPMRASPTVTISAGTTLKFQVGTSNSSDVSQYFLANPNNFVGANFNNTKIGNFVVGIDGQTDTNFSSDGAFTRGVAIGDFTLTCSSEL